MSLSDVPRPPKFILGGNIQENVRALRVALGSVMAELSAAKLAALISERHSARSVSPSLVQRWEAGVEPDFESVRIMAALAGVSFEEFALGVKRSAGIIDPARDRKLTDEEIERASATAARDRARNKASARKKNSGGR